MDIRKEIQRFSQSQSQSMNAPNLCSERYIHFTILQKVIIIDDIASHKCIVSTLSFLFYLVIISKITKEQIVNNVFQKAYCCWTLLVKPHVYYVIFSW